MTRHRQRPGRVVPLGAGHALPPPQDALRASERVHSASEGVSGHREPPRAAEGPPGGVQRLVLDDFPDPADARALSPNGRVHWATRNAARKEVASRVVVEATRSGLRPAAGPVRLTFRYVYPDRRRRDVDNLATGVTKACVDALVRGRWLAADDSEHVVGVEAVPVVERGRRRLEIIVAPASASDGAAG